LYRQINVKLFIKAEKAMDVKKLFIGLGCVGDVVMTLVQEILNE